MRGEPLADLALDHRHPDGDLRERLDRAQDDRRRDAVGQVGDDLGRRRVERGEVELDGVGEVQGRVGVRAERVAQGRLERAVDLDDVHVARPGGEVLGEHAEAAADLEHDVRGVELGRPADDAEQVRVDEEVLAELALGRMPKLPQPPQAGLPGLLEPLGHHPNSRAALASTAASSRSYSMPRRSATKRAVCTTFAGWLRSLRTTWGVR